MFQDINPYHLDNQFRDRRIAPDDYVVVYRGNTMLLRDTDAGKTIPTYSEVSDLFSPEESTYLLSVDNTGFYLFQSEAEVPGFGYYGIFELRGMEPAWLAFAGATALHLAHWYECHKYCGKCAAQMEHSDRERAVICPHCGHVEYPKISPVVIVAITDGERLLLTRYAHATYRRHALVAGFMEIGETFEETVRREVMEEVGLKLKNIRYYKSQPWAFSESVLAGFFAEIDGSCQVHVDQNELADAEWFSRDEIPVEDTAFSLTWDMIEYFKNGGGAQQIG